MTPTYIKSKQRVAEYGEVMTPDHVLNAMLDLVKQETERIDSRFLEPACGTGNFLEAVLRRKLEVVDGRYRASQLEWERYAVTAMSSLYGIDILEDNVVECRDRLFALFNERYEARFKRKCRVQCRASVRYLLATNIIWGDALSLERVGDGREPILFAEWSVVNGSLFKRRDFIFRELLREREEKRRGTAQKSLFGDRERTPCDDPVEPILSDTGEMVFIPRPIREYPLVHFLELSHAYE